MEDQLKKIIILGIVILLFFTGISSNISADFIISKAANKNSITINPSSNSNFEYIIITNEYLADSDFQRLIQHKSQYLTATIVTIEDILINADFQVNGKYGDGTNEANGNHWIPNGKEVTKNFSNFDDEPARIRNFLRFAYDEWNTKYVLIGGDAQIIPVRKLRINETWWYTGFTTIWTFANIRSDFYYTALDGTWNDDFDEHFGEASEYSINDEADYIAEMFIGRAPVDNKRDVKTFVDKVINFETSEKPENMLFHQAGINSVNIPDSYVILEKCLEHVPIEQYDVYVLSQKYTTIDPEKYARYWRDPDKLIVMHIGSGSSSSYYIERRVTGDTVFNTEDIPLLNNTFCPLHISISCNSGNFGLDHDCLAENMLLYPNYGPSSCFFNSFFGCASEDDVHKYSGEFIEMKFWEIFQNETERLGEISAKCRYHFINDAKNDLLYRWCYYTITLFGDPETSLFEVRNKIPIIDKVYVDDNYDTTTPGWGVTHFDNIQDALESVADSGTIYVNSGIYNENLEIDKPVNLVGEEKETTYIIGDATGDVIKILDEVTITGFTIKNSGSAQNDAGIKIHTQINIIKNNTITENKYGIRAEAYGDNKIEENRIFHNNFIDNTQNILDGYDDKFYGNYWDSYTGIDEDYDGIGDSPYSFNSGKDYCPFIDQSGWDLGINHKPILPIITGPSTGRPYKDLSFKFESADPDGDNVYIYVDMGDGAYNSWEGPFEAHDLKNLLYYYEKVGIYTIKAKARDGKDLETDLVRFTIVISKSRDTAEHYSPFMSLMIKFFMFLQSFKLNIQNLAILT